MAQFFKGARRLITVLMVFSHFWNISKKRQHKSRWKNQLPRVINSSSFLFNHWHGYWLGEICNTLQLAELFSSRHKVIFFFHQKLCKWCFLCQQNLGRHPDCTMYRQLFLWSRANGLICQPSNIFNGIFEFCNTTTFYTWSNHFPRAIKSWSFSITSVQN